MLRNRKHIANKILPQRCFGSVSLFFKGFVQVHFGCKLNKNKKPYDFRDGPFIPQDTQSTKSEYIESA